VKIIWKNSALGLYAQTGILSCVHTESVADTLRSHSTLGTSSSREEEIWHTMKNKKN